MPTPQPLNLPIIWAALGQNSNGIPKRNGANTATVVSPSSFGENIPGLSNAAAYRRFIFNHDIQFSATKPTTRSDGSALQLGDRWWDSGTASQWFFWNGTYWLTEHIYQGHSNSDTRTSANGIGLGAFTGAHNLFLIDVTFSGRINSTGTHDASNYWNILFARSIDADPQVTPDLFSAYVTESSYSTNGLATNAYFRQTNTLNVHRDVTALSLYQFQYVFTTVGSPASLIRPSILYRYRLAKP